MKKAGQRLMFLLSPAKTLNFAKTERPNLSFSNPALLNEVDALVIALKGMSKGKLKSLLKDRQSTASVNLMKYVMLLIFLSTLIVQWSQDKSFTLVECNVY